MHANDETLASTGAARAVRISIPGVSADVGFHGFRAQAAGGTFDLRTWRRLLVRFDPAGTTGRAFQGREFGAGEVAVVPEGALIVSVDTSWAKVRWPAIIDIGRASIDARILEAGPDGLRTLVDSFRASWAADLAFWLARNRPDLATASSNTGMGRVPSPAQR